MKRTTVRMLALVMAVVVMLQPTLALASAAPSWLSHLNAIRSMAGLSAVSENADASAACYAHSRYMSRNRVVTHSQDPALPYYSVEGDRAARRSNLVLGAGGLRALDLWAVGPFHAVGMIDPRLSTVGFGTYSASGFWPSAALDVSGKSASPRDGTVFPVLWPGPGSVSAYATYKDREYPDPLSGTGYEAPAGAPIIAQFGTGPLTPNVTASSLRADGRSLPHAVYTEATYRNTGAAAQKTGRSVLGSRDAVVIMPKDPLKPGVQYDVSLTVDGAVHSWSFTTAGVVDVALRAPRATRYAEEVAVAATLTDADGGPLAARDVTIERSADGVNWKPVDECLTCDSGTASASLAPTRRTFVRARFAGDGGLPARSSAPVAIVPAAKVSVASVPARVRVARSFEVTGSLYPKHAAGSSAVRVYAQRYEQGAWVTRVRANGVMASDGTTYAARITVSSAGAWRIRTKHLADTHNGAASSAWRALAAR